MKISPRRAMLYRLLDIDQAVRNASNRHFRRKPGFGPAGETPRFHAPCVPDLLYNVVQEAKLPAEHSFADLGSGFGMACFAAALHFEKVAGFEINEEIVAVARELKQRLKMGNVDFHHQDLRQADLSGFNVLHMFQPYIDNFAADMERLLARVEPGTVVISNIFGSMRRQIFSPEGYLQLYPPVLPSNARPSMLYVHQKA